MKGKAILAVVLVAVIAAATYGYLRPMKQHQPKDEDEDQAIASPSRVGRGANGQAIINLDLASQKLIALQTAPLQPATQPLELKAYGRVLEPASLIVLANDVASAKAALDASQKEYRRLDALFQQGGNASAKALETAQATMEHDQIALQTAQQQLLSTWGQPIAAQTNLPSLIQSLAKLQSVLVRLDLPAAEPLSQAPTGARLLLPGKSETVAARFLGPATTTDPQLQGKGFLFLSTNAVAGFAPGLAVIGFLQLPGAAHSGVLIPDAALVRSDARAWIYVQTAPTNFERQEIVLDYPAAGGWFVTNGLNTNQRVVVIGAQDLLSEERKKQIKIGD